MILYPLPDIFWVAFAGVLGAIVGSFANLVIHRLPAMLEHEWQCSADEISGLSVERLAPPNLFSPRSHCPQCLQTLRWWQNIPLLSYLWLRGRCGHCQHPIPRRYFGVELALAVWFAGAIHAHGALSLVSWFWCAWGAILLILAVIDWRTYLLPDSLTLGLLWLTLAAAASGMLPISANASIAGAILGYAMLAVPSGIFKWWTGRVGMAPGDFKLLAAVGAALGPWQMPALVLSASLIGIALSLIGRRWITPPESIGADDVASEAIPFGPAIALAATLNFLFPWDGTALQLPLW